MMRPVRFCLFVAAPFAACVAPAAFGEAPPKDNPVAERYKDKAPAWTGGYKWENVVTIRDFKGIDEAERFRIAQEAVAAKGGGVVFFHAGRYAFKDPLRLKNGVVLRGEKPESIEEARDEKYALRTKFEFPAYRPTFEGTGTPNDTAFKGVSLEDAAGGTQVGLVHIHEQ